VEIVKNFSEFSEDLQPSTSASSAIGSDEAAFCKGHWKGLG
jgi:hypothetical protein